MAKKQSLAQRILASKGINAYSLSDQEPDKYLSTGSLALNGIVSGDVFKGVLQGGSTALVGPSNTGKTFFLAHIVKSALESDYTHIIIFDSEKATKKGYYEKIGIDVNNDDRITIAPVSSTMAFRNGVYALVEGIKEVHPDAKIFIGVDSIGNMTSEKELVDVEKGKSAADMGNNAKAQNSASRIIAGLVVDYDITFVFINHVYANIGDLFATRGVIAGGSKLIYNSDTIIYLERLINKEEMSAFIDGKEVKKTKQHIGLTIKAATVKNRLYPEEKQTKLKLNFSTGLNEYSGLLDMALNAGVLKKKPKGYEVVATGKTIYEKDMFNEEVFTEEALQKINDWLLTQGYSNANEIFNEDVSAALEEDDE